MSTGATRSLRGGNGMQVRGGYQPEAAARESLNTFAVVDSGLHVGVGQMTMLLSPQSTA